ncbi:MAG TPA: hypothetical protein VGH69_06495 [Mycobacterium sp.]
MAGVVTLPSLSQLLDWPTEHLTDAAEYWEATAERNYGLASQVWRDASSVDWQGKAADALRAATHTDMIATGAAGDQLQTAAKVARSGASDLFAARSRLQYAVEDVTLLDSKWMKKGQFLIGPREARPRNVPHAKPRRKPSPPTFGSVRNNLSLSINKLPAKSPRP